MLKPLFCVVALVAVVHGAHHQTTTTTTARPKTTEEILQDVVAENQQLKASIDSLQRAVGGLTRQVMLQQTFVEERIRSDGSSGLKQIRNSHNGDRTYVVADHAGNSVASIHEHSSNSRTVGMGELNMVINGVEFRTRHNDYRLRMPASDKTYNKLVDIPYPDVPPEVLSKPTVPEQVAEMKEWFKAFKTQNSTVRDYRKYFKPVLCYMEGAWTTNTKTLEEPFFSDRHFIDASSWFDLQEKVRFTSYSGGKSNLENFSYLPTTIMNIINGEAEYAQWNYRIACHPLKNDLPTSAFEMIDDVAERMRNLIPIEKYNETRMARFQLRKKIPTTPRDYKIQTYHWGLLDDLMYEIPGRDNYGVNISDDATGLTFYDINDDTKPVNTANYHRYYKVVEKDAMGTKVIHRGFSDPNLFAAQTTQPQIAGLAMEMCRQLDRRHKNCTRVTQRYTWAVPLEIIYMTPLLTWNPYDLEHTPYSVGKNIANVVQGPNGIRNGQLTIDKAFNGTHNKAFYRTPYELFTGSRTVDKSSADTAKGMVGVLDKNGVIRKVMASGNRIILPAIEGVGHVRTRYPIMPMHSDGEQTRKEVDALKEMVMDMPKFSQLFEREPTTVSKAQDLFNEQPHLLQVAPTTHDPPGYHGHTLVIHQYDIEDMDNGHTIKGLLTSVDNSHQHSVDIRKNSNGDYIIVACDGMPRCWDGHDIHLTLQY